MSHELRTPPNGIIGFAELTHDGRVSDVPERLREHLGDIPTSAHHLRRLIDDARDAVVAIGQRSTAGVP